MEHIAPTHWLPSIGGQQQEEPLADLMDRAMAAKLQALNLSTVKQQVMALSQSKKLSLLDRIARAPPALQRVQLDSLGLDNTHAPLLAQILARPTTTELAVSGNALTEPGLLIIADAVLEAARAGRHHFASLSVGNQKIAISTKALTRLLDAMEASTLTTLRLGEMRDEGLRERHQKIAVDNNEAARLRRRAGNSKLYPPARRAVVGEPCAMLAELKDSSGSPLDIPVTQMAAQALGVAGRRFDGMACSPFVFAEKPALLPCCLPKEAGWYLLTFTCHTAQALRVALRVGTIELPPVYVAFEAH